MNNKNGMNAAATIESLNNRFLMKFNLTISLFADLIKIVPKDWNKFMLLNIKSGEIVTLCDEYKIAVAPAVAAYYLNCNCGENEHILKFMNNNYDNNKGEFGRDRMIEAELAALNEFRSAVLVGNFIVRIETFVKAAGIILIGIENMLEENENENRKKAAEVDIVISAKSLRELNKKLEIIKSIQLSTFINCGMMTAAGSGKMGVKCEDCGGELKMSYESAHLICMNCGLLIEICGSEYEKSSAGNTNSNGLGDGAASSSTGRNKARGQGSSGENRHLNKCLDFLFAMKECPLEDSEEDKIKKEIESSWRHDLSNIYCAEMRIILKELKLTKYNPYVPWLVKKFTGRGPPQFSIEEKNIIKNKFNRLAWWYRKLLYEETSAVTDGKSEAEDGSESMNFIKNRGKDPVGEKENLSHYYYFIYKIVEKEFKAAADKQELLKFIHLQSMDTIKKNDNILQKIGSASAKLGEDLMFERTKKFRR